MILDKSGKPYRQEAASTLRMGEVAWADPLRLGTAGVSTPYNPSSLVGSKGLRTFDEMQRDDQVKAALAFKRHAVVATGWQVKSPEGKPDDWEPKVFIEEVLKELDGTLERAIHDILSALKYGYSVTEKVWEIDEKGRIVLEALKTRRPHEIEPKVDVYGNLVGLTQMNRDIGPVEKFIVYAHDPEFGNWYGTSDLEAAYRAWWLKKNAYQWMAMLLERLGIPPIFAMYNPTAYPTNKLSDFQALLRNLQAATVGMIPRPEQTDLEMWSTEIKGGIEQVFIPALDRCDRDIAKALLMPGLLGMTNDAEQGSLARAQVHFDVFILVIERIRTEISKFVMNEHIVRPLVQYNFGLFDEYPCFEFNPLTDQVRVDLLTAWKDLTGAKVVTPQVDDERHVRSLLKFPDLSAEGEAKRAEQDRISLEMSQTMLENTKNPPAPESGDGKKAPPKKYAVKETKKYYAQIEDALDEVEGRYSVSLRDTLEQTRDALLSLVRRDFVPKQTGIAWVNNLTLKKFGAFQSDLIELLSEACELGSTMVEGEINVRANESAITVTPRAAVRAMTEKAIWIAGVVKGKLTSEVQAVLIAAVQNGEPLAETVQKLAEIFVPYIGTSELTKPEQTSPHRLETIVRTNTTDAYNTGRLAKMREPKMKPWLKAVRYSAVLDERTTDICMELHGSYFKPDDPMLDRLTPPNHFNCRSLLVPVMIDQKVDDSQWATREQVGRALDLMQPGFGGE